MRVNGVDKGGPPLSCNEGGAGAKRQRGMLGADGADGRGFPRSRGECPKDKGGPYQANNQDLPPTLLSLLHRRINRIQNPIQIP